MPDGQLAGLRVLELATGTAGPFCGKVLADFGADVVKVEPHGGDPSRLAGGFPDDALDGDSSAAFLAVNTGKRSVTLDHHCPTGARVLRRLVERSDAVVEDWPAGELERALGGPFPKRLVVCSISPFGRTGPKSAWRGGDLVGYAAGGLAHATGDAGREPLQAGCEQALHLAGLQALAGTLLALFHALRTGEGQRVDVSVQEAVASVLESTLSEYQFHGIVRERMGTHHPAVHGVGMQRLADGRFLFVGTCPRPAMWEAVKDVMGRPAWADDARWDDARVRRQHADEIDRLAAKTFSTRRLEEVYAPLQERGVPVGVVNSVSEAARSTQLRERGFFTEVDGTQMPGPLWKTTAAEPEVRRAPQLGEHTVEVLRELGFTSDDAQRWRRAGVI